MDQKFAELARMLRTSTGRGSGVRLLSVSFDPEHDTPEVLKRHAASRGARPPLWTFTVAEHAELRKVAEPLGLSYGPTGDQVIHNLSTAIIGPDGRLVRRLEGSGWDPADAFRIIRAARREQ
jgi:protein SCO1/2